MNKIEYWLLDAAIRLKIPFQWLSASNVDETLNRPHHHLSLAELLRVLEQMFERGDLFLEYADRSGQLSRSERPSRSEIKRALSIPTTGGTDPPEPVVYGVTDRGGARWEAVSHPRWDRFFDESYGMDPHEGEMTASSRGLIEERLAAIPHDPVIKAIVPESVRWSVLQPWAATYWKQLPIGHRIEFTYLSLTEAEKLARLTSLNPPPAWHPQWYTNYLESI